MNRKIFYKTSEFYEEIKHLREHGVHRGENVGFHSLDEFYTKKLGGTTYIYSAPFIGKSMFAWELSLNTAVKYGWITGVFSPESGTKAEQVAELMFKITGKELYSNHRNAVDDDLFKDALSFIEKHYIFIDPDEPQAGDVYENALLTLTDFYKSVRLAEKFYDISIQESLIDPFNELSHDFSKDEGRQDLYIERMLGIVRRDAKTYNRHNTIVTHITDQAPIQKGNAHYYPPPTARNVAGGQAWYRKGMMMLAMWKPPFGEQDVNGRPYEENEMHILVQKAKPRYCGKKGTVILFYDLETGRYYEKMNNKRYYSYQYDTHLYNLEKEHKILIQ